MMEFDTAATPQADAVTASDEAPRRSYFSSAPAGADVPADAATQLPAAAAVAVAVALPTAAETTSAVSAPAFVAPAMAEVPAPAQAADAAEVAAQHAPAPAPLVSSASAPTPAAPMAAPVRTVAKAPVDPVASSMPRVASFALPIDELQQVAAYSGLQWVNSDAEKIAAVQAAIAAEPQPVRVPRARPAAVVLDEGPLVLVETRRDLSNMTLPFEQPPVA